MYIGAICKKGSIQFFDVMDVKVSVIIPCYNHGIYIQEAINSVLSQTIDNYEIIVVNDGSTDQFTNEFLSKYTHPKVQIFKTRNKGVSHARNFGIRRAKGKYILPLDADDKIGSEYLQLASQYLDDHPEVGIVYCQAEYFGAISGFWELPEFSKELMPTQNLIFNSAMFRKSDWKRVGGYNEKMRYGYEDWDFWLSFIERGLLIHRIDQILFYYRQHHVSSRNQEVMTNSVKLEKTLHTLKWNHKKLYNITLRKQLKYYLQKSCRFKPCYYFLHSCASIYRKFFR